MDLNKRYKIFNIKIKYGKFYYEKRVEAISICGNFFYFVKRLYFFYISPSILTNPNMGYNFIVK